MPKKSNSPEEFHNRCEACHSKRANTWLYHRIKDFDDEAKLRAHLAEQFPKTDDYALAAAIQTWREFRASWLKYRGDYYPAKGEQW